MIDSPVVAREYYPRVAERVAVRDLFRSPVFLLTGVGDRILVSRFVSV